MDPKHKILSISLIVVAVLIVITFIVLIIIYSVKRPNGESTSSSSNTLVFPYCLSIPLLTEEGFYEFLKIYIKNNLGFTATQLTPQYNYMWISNDGTRIAYIQSNINQSIVSFWNEYFFVFFCLF